MNSLQVRFKKHRLYSLALMGVILAIAAVFRFESALVNHFREDEAALSHLAQQIVSAHVFPALGIPSSVGVPNSPATAYFMAIPYLISSNPLFAVGFVAFCNVIGVWLLWLLTRQLFNDQTAYAAAIIYAANAWAIWYSGRIWAQDFHTPIILLGFLLGWIGFVNGNRSCQILCFPVLILGFQMHFAAWTLLPAVGVLLWAGRKHIRLWQLALGIVLAAFVLWPFVRGLTTSVANSTGQIWTIIAKIPGSFLHLNFRPWGDNLSLLSGTQLVEGVQNAPTWFVLAFGIITAIGFYFAWRKNRMAAVFLFAWAVIPLLVFTPLWTPPSIYYFVPSIPAFCLLQACTIAGLYDAIKPEPLRVTRVVVAGGLLALIVGWNQGQIQPYLAAVATSPQPGTGIPLYLMLKARDVLSQGSDVLVSPTPDTTVGFKVWQAFLYGASACIRPSVASSGDVLLPGHPFALLQMPRREPDFFQDHLDRARDIAIPLRIGEGSFTISIFDQSPLPDIVLTTLPDATFTNGIVLNAYAMQDNHIYLRWKFPGGTSQDYQFFVHLIDAQGNRLAQNDRTLYKHEFLCPGDELLTRTDLTIPNKISILRVGMYAFQGSNDQKFLNADLVDSNGTSIAPWLDIHLQP